MKTLNFTCRQDDDARLGNLDEFPDYQTQGGSFARLKEHPAVLYPGLSSCEIPCVHRSRGT
jgi:hypothetical protein